METPAANGFFDGMVETLRGMKRQTGAFLGAIVLGAILMGMATINATLSAASSQVVTFFTSNLGIAIEAFIGVAGVLWLLSLIFKSVGLHRRRSVG